MGKPFIRLIKDNISSRFRSSLKDVLSAFSIFDPKKCPDSLLMSYFYGESSIQTIIGQFGRDLPAKSLEGTEFEKVAIVSSDLSTYRQLLIKQPKDDISMQLKELLTNDMLIALFPHLYKLATISTASAEQSFSDMILGKNRLLNLACPT